MEEGSVRSVAHVKIYAIELSDSADTARGHCSAARAKLPRCAAPNGRKGAPELAVTDQPTPPTQRDQPPGLARRTSAPHPPGQLGLSCPLEPRPGRGAPGPRELRVNSSIWRLTASGQLCRALHGAFHFLDLPLPGFSPLSENILARPVYKSAHSFGDCPLEIRACSGMCSDSGLFLESKTRIQGKGKRIYNLDTNLQNLGTLQWNDLGTRPVELRLIASTQKQEGKAGA
ncbi:uncharacterized protein LOC117031500 [Rhinolophus ferrumequinum]|uniref:uncharacterized protein LOC117031500 n=1 Tax=Rhinolophus ferrumequinum TaxID=59479 RepID=UPI00140F5896|nr:uncharacterized protein LOC117031500 [Rhinolophus ferrumequinum]